MKNNLQNNSRIEEKRLDWKIIQGVMKEKFGSDIFDSWFINDCAYYEKK